MGKKSQQTDYLWTEDGDVARGQKVLVSTIMSTYELNLFYQKSGRALVNAAYL